MIFFRRRLILWLVKAYIRKWGRIIIASFIFGILGFFSLYFLFSHFKIFSFGHRESIGVLGVFNSGNIPQDVLENVSYGLTSVDKNGKIEPAASSSWDIKDDGKTYIFHIRNGIYFNDGIKLTSKEINYNFENVEVFRPDKSTIIFKLKESYSPFLVSVSRPIFRKSFVGLGDYKVKSLDLNGDFVESIQLQEIKSPYTLVSYQFYPTEESLKMALVLGEISKTRDLSDISFKDKSLESFANYQITKRVNYNKLVTLFFNTQDKVLSDKRLRQALIYALPNDFPQGKRNRTPYPPTLWADREDVLSFEQDIDHSKLLLESSPASNSASLKLNIKTLYQYKSVAEEIDKSWRKIGISTTIDVTNSLPSNFQIFLGEFYISKDPDQYTLWHSSSSNNLTGYKNLRIDKLLEDGRQTTDLEKREKIYADFQKYLLDDPPAAFLYLPYNYILSKK